MIAHDNGNSIGQNLSSIEKELGHSSESLLSQFRDASAQIRPLVSPEQLVAWAKEGLVLARYFPPSSLEAAAEYFRTTPEVLGMLPFPRFLDWVHAGKILCRHHPSLATAYFQASPRALGKLPHKLIEFWVEIGRSLCRYTPESIELAGSFLATTP